MAVELQMWREIDRRNFHLSAALARLTLFLSGKARVHGIIL